MIENSPSSTINGFILTRQWFESDQGQSLQFWFATDSGPVRVTLGHQASVFFIAKSSLPRVERLLAALGHWYHAPLQLKVFAKGDSEAVIGCYFDSQKLLNVARARLQQAEIPIFEADIRPTDRYLMERFITGAANISGALQSADQFQFTDDPKLTSVDYSPVLNVLSLDIETSYTENILYSIAVCSTAVKKVFMVATESSPPLDYLEYLPNERAVICAFLTWFQKYDADVVIGWSVVGFDLWFLQQRCDALDIEFTLGRDNQLVQWRKVSATRERNIALVPGRVILDGIELLRTATYQFESFALDFVARQLLGRGKLVDDVDARASEIQHMYATDKISLAEYNLEDCVLVLEIFEKTDLINFAVERSKLTGLDMDRPGGSVAAFDFLYLPRLHRHGFVAPVRLDDSGSPSPGGFVLESKPGLYEHVVVLDFKSLYPSIIRTFHIDPLALISAGEGAIPGFLGAAFARDKHILPGIIEQLWQARDRAKQTGRSASSQAIKIIMNSFYGVMGTSGCRFFDARLVSSITLRGHEILLKTRDLIEEYGFEVIYGDTDSVFVLLTQVNADEPGKVDQVAQQLADYLSGWWRDYLATEYDLPSSLEVEYETHFNQFLMPTIRGSEKGSKKRYAGLIGSGEQERLVFKGLETVRSDWSLLAREFQRELYRKIFKREPYEPFIKALVEAVYDGQCDDKLVLRRRLRRKLEDYQKNVPPHVRAARRAEEIRKERGLPPAEEFGGRWVEYVMTTSGPEPRLYRESPIDYQFYVDKQLAPIADAILLFRQTSLAQITDKQLGLF